MKCKLLLLASLTLISLAMPQTSPAQSKEPRNISGIFIVPAKSGFYNPTDSTYFAMPRLMLENLVVKGKLADTLEAFAKNLAVDNDKLLESANKEKSSKEFWRTLALGSTAVIVAEVAIIIIVNR